MKQIIIVLVSIITFWGCKTNHIAIVENIKTGAEKTETWLPKLQNKRVALVANHTSLINDTHLADSLLALNINLVKIFSPEHGFRGKADAGEYVNDSIDAKTGVPVVSLYGKHKKPFPEDLQGIDLVVFDIQDVGVRFYTYTSTMHYVMEACAEQNIPVLVFDRPNPNGFFVDGPVLDTNYRSFVGMHPVPLVHGMTIAEYAKMINTEGWLKNGIHCDLSWVCMEHYTHDSLYVLPVKPSPNLPNITSVYLYPSLGFFEGTVVSAGRGTDFPFQTFGHPKISNQGFNYVPRSIEGASKYPKFKGDTCYGVDLRGVHKAFIIEDRKIHIDWLIFAWNQLEDEPKFFNNYFKLLAGSEHLRKQIEAGMSADSIRKTWDTDLNKFKELRKKYLLYPDYTY